MHSNKGFSLIELMIVVGIVGILSLIALPAYHNYVYRARIADLLNSASIYTKQGLINTLSSDNQLGMGSWPEFKGQANISSHCYEASEGVKTFSTSGSTGKKIFAAGHHNNDPIVDEIFVNDYTDIPCSPVTAKGSTEYPYIKMMLYPPGQNKNTNDRIGITLTISNTEYVYHSGGRTEITDQEGTRRVLCTFDLNGNWWSTTVPPEAIAISKLLPHECRKLRIGTINSSPGYIDIRDL